MQKAIVFLAVICTLMVLIIPAYSADLARFTNVKPVPVTGEELIPIAPYHPSTPGLIASSPGDTVGFTQYDYQSNSCAGRRVAVDVAGGVHVAWMNGNPFPSIRQIYYNCLTPSGWMWPAVGQPVSYRSGDGYCNLGLTPDDRVSIAYHNARALFCPP